MPNNPGDNRDFGKGSGSQQGGQGNKGNQNTGSQQNQQKQGQGQQGQGQGQGQQGKQQGSSSQGQGQSMSSGSKVNYQQQSAGKQSNIRLQLTPEQQAQVRRATGRDASSLELSVHDIEDSLDQSGEQSSRGESGMGEDESNTGSESEF